MLVYPRADAVHGVRRSGWNRYAIRAMGNKITLSLNGQDTVREYKESDPGIARDGLVAVQMHAGGSMEVQFRDMLIQPLPTPTASEPNRPGFHIRALKTDQGERLYTVYVPEGYDGTKTFPVILFLHGAGERGDDGVTPAQVGIGPAILNRQGGVAAVVVFPQARRTWSAASPDGIAAIQALDEVMRDYKVDPKARDPRPASRWAEGKLGYRHHPRRAVRRRRAHLRGWRPPNGQPTEGAAGLDLLRRR